MGYTKYFNVVRVKLRNSSNDTRGKTQMNSCANVGLIMGQRMQYRRSIKPTSGEYVHVWCLSRVGVGGGATSFF